MIVGFTGTRHGITSAQSLELRDNLRVLKPTEFHHGDCVGADTAAHVIAGRIEGVRIIIHPPAREIYRAFCQGDAVETVLKPRDYRLRNQDIVMACSTLIATPRESFETVRSGTWSTVRFARKMNRTILIIYPDGKMITQHPTTNHHE